MVIVRTNRVDGIAISIIGVTCSSGRAVRVVAVIKAASPDTSFSGRANYICTWIGSNINITQVCVITGKSSLTIPITLAEPNNWETKPVVAVGTFGTCDIVAVINSYTLSTFALAAGGAGVRMFGEGITTLGVVVVDKSSLACFTAGGKIMSLVIITDATIGGGKRR